MRVRAFLFVFPLALALALPTVCMAQEEATKPAQDAALAWLALTDAGQYGSTWEHAAAYFKASLTKAAWVGAITPVRAPLGAMEGRKLKSATFTRDLPGAPAGEYVLIQFDTHFQNKPGAVETVVPMREKDGSWKVSGYFIK